MRAHLLFATPLRLCSRARFTHHSLHLPTTQAGFDPLGLANFDLNIGSAYDKKRSAALVLQDYRDAELKHGRLAMLAAVAWPLQEKLNPLLAAKFHVPNLVAETGGLSPSVLNGGLEQGPIPGAVAVAGDRGQRPHARRRPDTGTTKTLGIDVGEGVGRRADSQARSASLYHFTSLAMPSEKGVWGS